MKKKTWLYESRQTITQLLAVSETEADEPEAASREDRPRSSAKSHRKPSRAEAFKLLNQKAETVDPLDVRVRFTNDGLPQEVVQELVDLCDVRRSVDGREVHVGRAVVDEIASFIDANPHLAVGVALGAAVGALTSMIPLLGSILAPLATLLGVIVGGIAGLRLDQGGRARRGVIGIAQDLITVAMKFFELLARLFRAVMPARAVLQEVPA